MDQHLVDHELEENRRDQPGELEEKRSDQDIAQRRAILDQCRDEPADVKRPGVASHRLAAGQQQGAAVKPLSQIGSGPYFGPFAVAALHQIAGLDCLIFDPQQNYGIAAGRFKQRGYGQLAQFGRLRRAQTGNQPEFAGNAAQVFQRIGIIAFAAIMGNLLWIGGNAQVFRQKDEAGKRRMLKRLSRRRRIGHQIFGAAPPIETNSTVRSPVGYR